MPIPAHKAIRQWFETNRPDVAPATMQAIENNPALSALVLMAFEAGRDFQRANPQADPIALVWPEDRYNWNY